MSYDDFRNLFMAKYVRDIHRIEMVGKLKERLHTMREVVLLKSYVFTPCLNKNYTIFSTIFANTF